MKVGVLAVQGCVNPHLEKLEKLGVEGIAVKNGAVLRECNRLILPGGESSTMLTILERDSFFNELESYTRNHPVWGICAGAILLAKEVTNPVQSSLNALPVKACRNFYGSQLDSFKTEVTLQLNEPCSMYVDFIRAPHLEPLDSTVEVLGRHNGKAICLRKGHVLVTAFHAELGPDTSLHSYFINLPQVHDVQAA
jgi:pyridoxal 5'-phosphate synthase pdxT subunit